MKSRTFLLLLVTAAVAGAAGWFAARRVGPVATSSPAHADHAASPGATAPDGSRRILFYQSAMHPWIRSDHPGKCTICGMELTPVFEGEAGLAVEPGLVSLSSNTITVLNVRTTEARRRPLTRTLRVAGTIDDDDSRHRFLSAYVGGRIEDLHVGYVGADVVAGQPLARFYSPMLLEAERQFVAILRTPVPAADASAGLAAEHRQLRDSAIERLRQLGLTDPQIEALPDKSPTNHHAELLAPVSGTVVNRFVYAGQYVMEGEKLFEIADLSTMWFRFDAYEQDLPWLEVGQPVEVSTPSVPGRTFTAPIRFIDPNLVEMSRSAKIRVELTNPVVQSDAGPRRLLRHRLYAEGRVQLTTSSNSLVIPRTAVLSPAGTPLVYVDRSGGTFEQRRVTLGRIGDTDCEVLAGLAEGDRVVVTGNLMIDAQAQLNQVIEAATHPHPDSSPPASSATAATAAPAPAPVPALDTPQAEAFSRLLAAADALRAALASDDLAAFRQALPAVVEATEAARGSLPDRPPWSDALQAVAAAGRIGETPDLRAARRAFHPLSVAVVALGQQLRRSQPAFANLKVYQCPMTAEAFDGAPARAQWLQLSPPLRNPWFGREMLDCGTEIRP